MKIQTTTPDKTPKPKPSGEKLQKILAGAGIGSRRKMESWIAEGRITINGNKASLGDRAKNRDVITLDGTTVKLDAYNSSVRRVLAYNKPEGEICSRADPQGRPSIFDKLPRLKGNRWIAIGRLDINTSGLILFTTDGELACRLMHPSNSIEREYAVRVMGRVTPEKVQRLYNGVDLDDKTARFTDIVSSGGSGINSWFHVCILEGRNREVRRLWESQNLTVSRLKRVRFGNTIMPEGLRAGHWQELDKSHINQLSAQVNLQPASANPKQHLGKSQKQTVRTKNAHKKIKHNRALKPSDRTNKKTTDKPKGTTKKNIRSAKVSSNGYESSRNKHRK